MFDMSDFGKLYQSSLEEFKDEENLLKACKEELEIMDGIIYAQDKDKDGVER